MKFTASKGAGMYASQSERDEFFRATTCPYRPADPGDFRFEVVSIIEQTDDPQMATLVLTIDDRGEAIGRDVFASWDDPYAMIEAAREAQAIPLEDRLEMYAARGM